MDRYNFAQSIPMALHSLIPEREFYVLMNSKNDDKYPVYVHHCISVESMDHTVAFVRRKRVHSGDTDRDTAFRELCAELIADIITAAVNNESPFLKTVPTVPADKEL